MFARLKSGSSIAKNGVTGVADVADVAGYARKPQQLRQLRPLRPESGKVGKCDFEGVISGVVAPTESDEAEILERAGLCAGSVSAIYLDTWARLNHQRPVKVSEAEWRQALDNGGRFLDRWRGEAALWGWTAGELFDVPRDGQRGGLFWFIAGATVEAFGPDHASLSDGRLFERGTIRGKRC